MRAILTGLPISSSQYVTLHTPIDTANGAVYIGNVEPGGRGDGRGATLDTVIRRGVPGDEGAWTWTSTTIDARTVWDKWHALPSLGVDGEGHLHVAYNMHNFPWQYGRFSTPDSIEGFEFLGEPISDEELRLHVEENRTGFGTPGTAAVPGTQVTYPAFARDREGALYLSSRQAARPAREFTERTMGSGLARYDVGTRQWSAIGGRYPLDPGDVETADGSLPPPVLLAARTGWTSYSPDLEFDADNRLHATWLWTEGIADATLERPCVVVRHGADDWRLPSGTVVAPPLVPQDCAGTGPDDAQGYRSVIDTAMDSRGRLHVVLDPLAGEPYIAVLEDGRWRRMPSPDRAGLIFFDAEDGLWAIADGPRAYRLAPGGTEFERVLDAAPGLRCYPHAALSEDRRRAYVHARSCTEDVLDVYEIELLSRP